MRSGSKKLKSQYVTERLEKVESDMIAKKSVIRKEVKSTNEEETRGEYDFQSKEKCRKISCGVCNGCVWKDGCMPAVIIKCNKQGSKDTCLRTDIFLSLTLIKSLK